MKKAIECKMKVTSTPMDSCRQRRQPFKFVINTQCLVPAINGNEVIECDKLGA